MKSILICSHIETDFSSIKNNRLFVNGNVNFSEYFDTG